jgi:hypothetical protein
MRKEGEEFLTDWATFTFYQRRWLLYVSHKCVEVYYIASSRLYIIIIISACSTVDIQ